MQWFAAQHYVHISRDNGSLTNWELNGLQSLLSTLKMWLEKTSATKSKKPTNFLGHKTGIPDMDLSPGSLIYHLD
jgi:hypothetical protein